MMRFGSQRAALTQNEVNRRALWGRQETFAGAACLDKPNR